MRLTMLAPVSKFIARHPKATRTALPAPVELDCEAVFLQELAAIFPDIVQPTDDNRDNIINFAHRGATWATPARLAEQESARQNRQYDLMQKLNMTKEKLQEQFAETEKELNNDLRPAKYQGLAVTLALATLFLSCFAYWKGTSVAIPSIGVLAGCAMLAKEGHGHIKTNDHFDKNFRKRSTLQFKISIVSERQDTFEYANILNGEPQDAEAAELLFPSGKAYLANRRMLSRKFATPTNAS